MAYFDVEKIKIRFRIKFPRFEYLLDKLPIVFDDTINTACTDGEKLYFNRSFMESLDEEQQLFVFAHELLHVALNHIDRCLDKDPYYWNLATDAVINDYLRNDGLKMIDNCVDIVGALNHTAEELYEKLKKEDEEKKQDKKDSPPPEQSNKKGNGKPTDSPSNSNNNGDNDKKDENGNNRSDNSSNNDEDENKKDENGNNKSDNSSGNEKENRTDQDNVGHDSHERWRKAAEKHKKEGKNNTNNIKENEEFDDNTREKKKRDDDYLQNGVNNSNGKHASNGTGSRSVKVAPIDSYSDESVPWQDLLHLNARNSSDWDYTYGEVENGVVVPVFDDEESFECEIVIDTSGSISSDLIRNFLIETLSIIETSKVKVGFFDTEFYGFNDVRDANDVNDLEIVGRGGTDFNAAVSAFSPHCANKIIFTDGEAPMPDEEIDAIWVVVGYYKHEIYPKGGTVIYICGEEYEKLLNNRGRSR